MLYTGVVENRYDPLKLGRCQVRIVGLHTHDKNKLPTSDLPWAMPMAPITSASVSGIGQTPLGLVEGAWVVLMFQDEDCQYPIIIGSLGGIPQTPSGVDVNDSTLKIKIDGSVTQTNEQSSTVVDGSGNPVTTGDGTPVTTGTTETSQPVLENTNSLKRAAEYTASANCINLIKRFEGFRNKAYQDSVGIWTIGYGTIRVNGRPVAEGDTCTKEQAESYLLEDMKTVAEAPIKRNTRSLISQSMYDALVCFTYNVGPGNFAKSTLLKDLNSSKYLDAAAGFMQWNKAGGKELAGLTKRRSAEKDLFLAEGVPNSAGELPPPVVSNYQSTTTSSQQSASGETAVTPDTGVTGEQAVTMGFEDPNKKYPLYFNEPDTNRLARHEEINKTIVYSKEAAIDEGVESADGSTWDQSPIPYNAQYPFNHVMQTESGHVLEFDDTPNSERIHMYHKAGTFTEIDANGTRVTRIVGDNYEILERNGYVHINGSLNVTVDGAQNLYVKNALNINVDGATTINVYNDTNINVSGNANLAVGGTFAVIAEAIKMEADSIDLKSSGDINIDAAGEASVKAGGNAKLDGSQVHLGMGANSADSSGVPLPDDVKSPEMPEFNKLTVVTRSSSAAGQYETPDEGDATAYQQKQINSGSMKAEDIGKSEKQEEAPAPAPAVTAAGANCDIINSMSQFEPGFMLSKNYNIGHLTKNGSRPIIAQQGLSVQQIACNLKGLAENCLEPIRNLYPNLILTSVFRRPGDVAGSSKTSDHYLGCAADIVLPGKSRKDHYEAIQKIQQLVPYDQLLLEYQGATTVWIHVSFKYTGAKKQVFTMADHKRIGEIGKFVLVA
jgi:GH24 family phage-related lysozyme (muramidase)